MSSDHDVPMHAFSLKRFRRQLDDELNQRLSHPEVDALQQRLAVAQSEISIMQNSPSSPEKFRIKHECAVLTDELIVMKQNCEAAARRVLEAQTASFHRTAEQYHELMKDRQVQELAEQSARLRGDFESEFNTAVSMTNEQAEVFVHESRAQLRAEVI